VEEVSAMEITVNADLCSGQGRCYAVAPELFSSDDQGFCAERGQTRAVPVGLERTARLAADSCPEGAISLSD
jgi:ferredoxin